MSFEKWSMPPSYKAHAQKVLAAIQNAQTPQDTLLAGARAEGFVEALELVHAVPAGDTDQMAVIFDNAQTARLDELANDA